MKRDAATGIRMAMVVGLPSSIGMDACWQEAILTLLFRQEYSAQQLRRRADLLQISA